MSKHVKAVANVALLPMCIKYGYDLRTPQAVKYEDMGFSGWTVFVNRRGTLAHIMRSGRPWLLIRIPWLRLKGCSDEFITKVMRDKLYDGIC